MIQNRQFRTLMFCTTGALALSVPGIAMAQEQQAGSSQDQMDSSKGQMEEIIVAGVRASVVSALATKRAAAQIVDSIEATDIGKLPDVSTVESLQRVAGVQIQRRYGEGGTDYDHRTEPAVTIRGITQVRNFIDGQDFFTANGGRAPDLEGFPSELLAGIDVYKNPSANLIEGGIGGAINVRTRLPFDSADPVNSVTVKANYYDRAKKTTPSVSGLISRQFDVGEGRMGFLLGATYSRTQYRQDAVLQQQQHFITAASNPASFNSFPNKGSLTGIYVPTSFEMYQDSGKRERLGIAGAFQWEPNDGLLFTVRGIHSRYKFYRRGEYFYGHDKGSDPLAAAGSTFTWDANGNALTGSLSPQLFASSRFDQDVRNYTTNISTTVDWQVSSRLKSRTTFQYEHATYDADRNGDSITNYPFENTGTNSDPSTYHRLNLNFDVTGRFPVFSVTDPSNPGNPYAYLGDINNWYYEWFANAIDRNRLNLFSVSEDLDLEVGDGFLKQLHAGVRYSDTNLLLRGNWDNTGICQGTGRNTNWSSCQLVPVALHPNLAYVGPASNFMRPGVGLPVVVFPEFARPTEGVLTRTVATYNELFAGTTNPYAFNMTFNQWDTNQQSENTLAGYLSADFGGTLAGLEFDGTAGVRLVRTKSQSTGFVLQNGTMAPIDISNDYFNALPSFNLRMHLSDKLQLRFAYGKSVTRANFSDMAAHVQLNANVPGQFDSFGRPTGSSGNPYLSPMKADSYDVTAEYYWGRGNAAYANLFHKDVTGYLAGGIQVMNFGGVDYSISTNINLGKGRIRGFELGYTQFFDFLPGLLSGFGVQANYTYVDSKVQTGPGTFMPLPKLSKNSYNLVGIYEKGPLQARVAYNWRSAYLDQLNGSGVSGRNQYAAPYSSLDASVSVRLNDIFTVSLDAVNLTNSTYHTYIDSPDHGLLWQLNDRRYSASLRANF